MVRLSHSTCSTSGDPKVDGLSSHSTRLTVLQFTSHSHIVRRQAHDAATARHAQHAQIRTHGTQQAVKTQTTQEGGRPTSKKQQIRRKGAGRSRAQSPQRQQDGYRRHHGRGGRSCHAMATLALVDRL